MARVYADSRRLLASAVHRGDLGRAAEIRETSFIDAVPSVRVGGAADAWRGCGIVFLMSKNEQRVDWNAVMAAHADMFAAALPHGTTIWHEVDGWRAFAERFETRAHDGDLGANMSVWIDKHDKDLPEHMVAAADAIDGLKHILDTGLVPRYYQESGGDAEDFLEDSARAFASVARRLRSAFDASHSR